MGRREFLAGGIAALGLGAFAAGRNAAAQAKPHRIDVHHHVSPPSWLDAVKKAKLDNPPMVNWSPQKSLDDMDQAGIATAIVSPTTPQVVKLWHRIEPEHATPVSDRHQISIATTWLVLDTAPTRLQLPPSTITLGSLTHAPPWTLFNCAAKSL